MTDALLGYARLHGMLAGARLRRCVGNIDRARTAWQALLDWFEALEAYGGWQAAHFALDRGEAVEVMARNQYLDLNVWMREMAGIDFHDLPTVYLFLQIMGEHGLTVEQLREDSAMMLAAEIIAEDPQSRDPAYQLRAGFPSLSAREGHLPHPGSGAGASGIAAVSAASE